MFRVNEILREKTIIEQGYNKNLSKMSSAVSVEKGHVAKICCVVAN